MSQALTVYLPDDIFYQLQQTAQLAKQSTDIIVAHSLSQSISPFIEDIPEEFHSDVYPLLEMTEAELNEEVQKTYPVDKEDLYEALLEKKKECELSDKEQSKLNELRRDADLFSLRKGYAAVLLKRRGYPVPQPSNLPLPA